jgi:D-amino-acid dehydrogenase
MLHAQETVTMGFFGDDWTSPYDRRTIAVIGAGIAGITAAYSLVRRGYSVEVIEAEPGPARLTSHANGGQFSVSNADTWCTWYNVGNGLKWMLKADAPLLVRPMPTLSKLRWMSSFLWHTARGTHRANTLRTIQLALAARELYGDIAAEEGIQFDHSQSGILHVYKDPKLLQKGLAQARFYSANGVERHALTPAEILQLEPSLGSMPGLVGGTITPGDGMGDIFKFTAGLAAVLAQKYSVEFIYGHRVANIVEQDDNQLVCMKGPERWYARRYAHVVIAAGANSSGLGFNLYDWVNVYPVKGYSITIPVADGNLLPRTSLLDDSAKIVTSTLGDRLRVAGTAELDGWNLDIRAARICPLVDWVRANLPGIDTDHYTPWAGLRPMTGSMMPIVRQSKHRPRIWWHTGHGHLGLTLAAATAEMLADQIATVHQP